MIGPFNAEWATAPQWALMYRERGLQVVPAHRPGEGAQWKRPFGDWLEFRENLTSDAVFSRWFHPETGEHRARRNMGLILGRPSGGLFAIDLDRKEGSGAFDWWARIVNVHFGGVEPLTWAQTTGGGGRQVFFKAPPHWTPPTFKTGLCVDLRGQGGFVICPPSLHQSQRIYDWEDERGPWQAPLADADEALIEEIEELREDYGGAPGGQSQAEHTPSPGQSKNDWGRDIDGREAKIRDAVWAAVVDMYRECPIPLAQSLQDAEIERLWTQFQLTTKSRLTGDPGESNGELLEREGRGLSEFRRKWAYAMRQWDSKVAEAAKVPKPESQDGGPVRAGQVSDASGQLAAPDSTQEQARDADPICAGDLHGQPPERLWLVTDWIAQNEVNSLYGMGGTGKSLLAQQLAYSAATGEPWLGLEVKPCETVLAVLCEDKLDELHRRHEAIRLARGHAIGNPYGGVYLWPRYGFNNTLLTYERDAPIYGPFHDRLKQQLQRLNPGLLILDTIRDVFGGDERDPQQANAFLKTVLGGLILAQKERGHSLTVMLVGHPSVLGAKEGTGLAGSLAWENGVRCRLYLSKPEEGSGDERTLAKGKANYSASGAATGVALLWQDGVFTPTSGQDVKAAVRAGGLARLVREKVEFAWSINRPYTARADHDRHLYKLLPEQLKDGTGCSQATALRAVREAIDDGLIMLSKNSNKRGWKPAGAADE
jgi:hypothetical protein